VDGLPRVSLPGAVRVRPIATSLRELEVDAASMQAMGSQMTTCRSRTRTPAWSYDPILDKQASSAERMRCVTDGDNGFNLPSMQTLMLLGRSVELAAAPAVAIVDNCNATAADSPLDWLSRPREVGLQVLLAPIRQQRRALHLRTAWPHCRCATAGTERIRCGGE